VAIVHETGPQSPLNPTTQATTRPTTPLASFTGRLLIVVGIAALAVALWQLADILIVLFGAILLAIALRAATRVTARLTRLREPLALAAVIFLGLTALGAALWVFGSVVAAQLNEVINIAPAGFQMFIQRLGDNAYGRHFLDQARGLDVASATGWATTVVTTAARSVTRGLGYALVTFFVAIYLAAQPDRYRHLCLRLVPPAHRHTIQRLLDQIALILRRWLAGQLVVMTTIGLLSGLGLWLLGIEAAFALGLMGGLLCFIPFVGAILAAVPATLVALTQGPVYALSVILMYAGVHFIEGNFITPMVQAEATSLPPALAILATVAFSLLFGPSGTLFAAPLMLFILVTVEVLYVQAGLGEPPQAANPSGNRIRRRGETEPLL
jgi:predicted PurR-regulated permease PerM